ncbi:MAG: ABC transporter permease [Bifidobacteriaceae bacterium]|jgi:ABC-2 type transport system permease protein|nr:ABC transporter permease [Bifidobacteriaceae bacterium]
MRNTLAQARRVLAQFRHDPRTMALFILAPILVLWLFSALLGTPAGQPKLIAVDVPDAMISALGDSAEVTVLDASAARGELAAGRADAIVRLDGDELAIEVEGSNASVTARTLAAIQTASRTVAARAMGVDAPEIAVTYLHGSADWTNFDYFGPVFIGIFIFVFVFITSGMSLVTERTGGTMERLLVTPIKSWQLVAGYCLGFGLVSVIQAGIVLWASVTLIGFPNEGGLGPVVVLTFSMAMVSLTLGLLVSAMAKTAFQVIQFMILLVVPQILLSGIFDLTWAPRWMQVLSQCLPISHGAEALRDIMLRGAGLADAGANLAILWGFIAAFFALACLSFWRRRSR